MNGPAPDLGSGRQTLTEVAYRRLEEMIVTLELAPGAVVSEAILSRRLGIGMTPVREATQRLKRDHLLQVLPRRGVVVTAVDVRLQLEVLEVRREVDRLIARGAARRAAPEQRSALAALAPDMEAAATGGDVHLFLRLHKTAMPLLADAARNAVAAGVAAPLHAVSRRFWFYHRAVADVPRTVELHADVLRQVVEGREAEAAAANDRLLDHLAAFARATLQG